METSEVKFVTISPDAEKTMAQIARVSNPKNQNNHETAPRLLRYCAIHKHWSVFEQSSMTLEIKTSRALSAQIIRHWSFRFQEWSQRYAEVPETPIIYKARRQDTKNRQNSIDDLKESDKEWFEEAQYSIWNLAYSKYQAALEKGIAKECARFLLPLNSRTRLYMTGTIRSWIHYIELRSGHGTQTEHQEIANKCKEIFIDKLPIVSEALGWSSTN